MASRVIRRRFAGPTGEHKKVGHRIHIPVPTRRTGMVHNVARHGLKSWLQRGGGVGASYKD